jgi:hypothetical protein
MLLTRTERPASLSPNGSSPACTGGGDFSHSINELHGTPSSAYSGEQKTSCCPLGRARRFMRPGLGTSLVLVAQCPFLTRDTYLLILPGAAAEDAISPWPRTVCRSCPTAACPNHDLHRSGQRVASCQALSPETTPEADRCNSPAGLR